MRQALALDTGRGMDRSQRRAPCNVSALRDMKQHSQPEDPA